MAIKPRLICFFSVLVFTIGLLTASLPAFAQATQNTNGQQTETQQPAQNGTAPSVDPASWRAVLDSTQQALTRDGLTDNDLEKLRNETQRVGAEAAAQADMKRGEADLVRQRIDSLGPVPAEGEPPESEAAKEQRRLLNEELSVVDADLGLARQTVVRAAQLSEQIGNLRHERFFRSISIRTPGILDTGFWNDFAKGFRGFFRSLSLLFSDSISVFWKTLSENWNKLLGLGFVLPLTLLAFIRLRRLFDKATAKIPEHSQTAAVSGFLFYLKNGILPAIALAFVYGVFAFFGLLTNRFDQFLAGVVVAVGFAIAFIAVVRVIFAPQEASRRIARISDAAANRIFRILSVGILSAAVVHILNTLAIIFVSPIEVKVGLSFVFALLISISSIRSLYIYREDRNTQMMMTGSQVSSRFWRFLVMALWGASIAILGAAIAGYVAFAEFVSQQMIFGIIVILTCWLLLRFVDFIFLQLSADELADTAATETASGSLSNSGQAAILGSGLLKLVIYIAGGILLMLPWGYRTSDFFQIFEQAFFGFEVGGLSISISTILLAMLLFLIGYTVTVALRNWLNNKFLPTTALDIGVSNSISTVFGYIGVVIAAMLAISAAGFDLSNLAIVAGALSLGVGFGLQSIVSNFVSGLILLAERPIKAGDWVSTSGGDGYVRKISVRSTEIETFDRATIIVPNSSLISDTVTNWTHGNKMGRISIPVGVGYDSDPEQVQEILLQCAKDHKLVLGRPAPVVYFMDFGASSLDFQLRCFLSDINYGLSVSSELRFEILKQLRAANIEIPFPQREVTVKSGQPVEMAPPPKRTRKPATRKS